MITKGEKMLPRGLIEIVKKVTPQEIFQEIKLEVFHKKHKSHVWGGCSCEDMRIGLYPTVLLFPSYLPRIGVRSFNMWFKFLECTLDLIGQVVNQTNDESITEQWAKQKMNEILIDDDRLGQPHGFIGGLPGIYILRSTMIDHWTFRDNYRAYRVDGQLTLSQVVDMVLDNCLNVRRYEYRGFKQYIRRYIKKQLISIGIDRIYTDSAGRKHHFFNYGEAWSVVHHVMSTGTIPKLFTAYKEAQALKEYNQTLSTKEEQNESSELPF